MKPKRKRRSKLHTMTLEDFTEDRFSTEAKSPDALVRNLLSMKPHQLKTFARLLSYNSLSLLRLESPGLQILFMRVLCAIATLKPGDEVS